MLKDEFQENPRPSVQKIDLLAEKTGLPVLKLTRWFYNARGRTWVNNGKKRVALHYKKKQKLLEFFANKQVPSTQELKRLSNDLKLAEKTVLRWFSRRRYTERWKLHISRSGQISNNCS